MTDEELYNLILLALCVWREARGTIHAAKLGVAYSVLNRAKNASWWGTDINTVILKPLQYSSFNKNDPNSVKFPALNDTTWTDSLLAAKNAISGKEPDPTKGATNYYSAGIPMPVWAKTMKLMIKIDTFSFFK